MKEKLRTIFLNFLVFTVTIFLCLLATEFYFKRKIKWSSEATSAVNLPIFAESSYRSWGLKSSATATHGFGNPTPKILINSLGLRNDEISEEKIKKRVLLLGDSFVFGMGSYQDKTISTFLNKKFTGEKYTRVINAGVIGQTVDDAYLYLKNDGVKLKPDVVVYHFFVGNDITEFRRHNQTYSQTGELVRTEDSVHYVTSEGYLRKKSQTEPSSYFIYWLSQTYFPKADPSLTWPVFFSDDDPRGDANLALYWGEFFETLKHLNSYCEKNGIDFLVSIVPMDVQVSERYWDKYPQMPFGKEEFEAVRPQKRIGNLLKEEKIPYVDLLPLFQEVDFDLELTGDYLYFEKDPHFNERGNMRAANAIYLKMLELNFL